MLSGGGCVAAGCLLVVCAWLRPDVAIGLVVLGAVFVTLERRWPVVEQRVFRRGWAVDVVHFVVDQVLAGALVAVVAYVLVPLLEPLLADLDTLVDARLRFILAAVLGEITGYWGHRAMHRVPFLWRLHSVHHSSPVMDWLAPNRRHVLDTALGQAASAIPLSALGLSPPMVVSAFVLRRAQGLFVHANVRVHLPSIRWVIATPEFHHWHHSADLAHHDSNFAGQCPIVDRLFGTLHMPVRSWPESYGLAAGVDAVPLGYIARLRWPFRGAMRASRRHPARCAAAIVAGFAVTSGAVVAASALEPEPLQWNYSCRLRGDHASFAMDIGPTGVVIGEDASDRDVTTLRNVDGDPTIGIGIRVIRNGAAPLTVHAESGAVGSVVAVSTSGPEGTSTGTCLRRADAPPAR